MVLYSDGLVERRTEPIDEGLARLLRVASGTHDAAAICVKLMSECRDPAGGDDDATVLAVSRNQS